MKGIITETEGRREEYCCSLQLFFKNLFIRKCGKFKVFSKKNLQRMTYVPDAPVDRDFLADEGVVAVGGEEAALLGAVVEVGKT